MKRVGVFYGLIAIFVIITTVSAYADEYQYSHTQTSRIRRAWYGGFMGYINLSVRDDVTSGWKMVLEFRRRIKYLEICGAQIEHISDDRRMYHLVNETWDGVLSRGDSLRMFFTADTFPKVRGQVAKVHFYIRVPYRPPYKPVTEISYTEDSVTDVTGRTAQNATDFGSTTRIDPSAGTSTEVNNASQQTSLAVSVSNTITPSTATPTMGQPSTAISGDVCKQTCGSSAWIRSEWDGNFGGEMAVPVTYVVGGGWNMEIWFQNRVTSLQIWNARVVSSRTTNNDETVYTVRNQNYNDDLAAGSTLQMTFTASIPFTEAAQPFYVNLLGQPECACGSS